MNSAAHDIALYLVDAVGLTFGSNLFVASEPQAPDDCTTIYDYPGGSPDTDQMDVRLPNFQVRTRSLSFEEANERQEQILGALISDPNEFEAGTSRFSVVVLNTDVSSLGRDGNGRFILVASYRARRTEKET